jgi:hypothetical protein
LCVINLAADGGLHYKSYGSDRAGVATRLSRDREVFLRLVKAMGVRRQPTVLLRADKHATWSDVREVLRILGSEEIPAVGVIARRTADASVSKAEADARGVEAQSSAPLPPGWGEGSFDLTIQQRASPDGVAVDLGEDAVVRVEGLGAFEIEELRELGSSLSEKRACVHVQGEPRWSQVVAVLDNLRRVGADPVLCHGE